MIVVDTSVVVAFMNAADAHHRLVADWMDAETEDLVTTPLIVAEVDYLVAARGGPEAAAALRADLASGAYLVNWWSDAMAAVAAVADTYAGLRIGLADASLVALAERIGTIDIATLDQRHFRSVRPLGDRAEAFRLLPLDL
ncbi:MAG: PIN domain-containing protein [Solirubrobacterales bacterium]